MTIKFETDEALDKAMEELAATAAPNERVLLARLPDGSYGRIGVITKDPDCDQDDFDFVMNQLANTYEQ